ncbi:PP2C family protein-serine/threonine phosphatase [Janibacter corallicola]|uniref:PP2C family protein-serine/threonine phosphatase n=1 Tax=Janibacter corallicola TaxID=415212 RepID=UPI0008309D80|nr:PP2C family protein-serine/threonine phosphatase [Janibacter corallicola]
MSAILPGRAPALGHRPIRIRRTVSIEGTALLLILFTGVVGVAVGHYVWPEHLPLAGLLPACLLATTLCHIGQARLILVTAVAAAGWMVLVSGEGLTRYVPLLISIALLYGVAVSRAHHGAATFAGDRMLGDLRSRLHAMGAIPPLPAGYHAERSIATAHGSAFAGDFLIMAQREAGEVELVLADVSGKGQEAGTRALMLAGALGGVLGSAQPQRVLPMANEFLDRASWKEGFATAVHVRIDFTTGATTIASAGHPPALHYDAGSGRWSRVDADCGPALGILGHAEYPQVETVLGRGDALLVYTDGVIESRSRCLDDGIDWVLGEAESRLPQGLSGLADVLVQEGRAGVSDDRAAVVIWRD